MPYGEVFLDGTSLGPTPVTPVVSAGVHRVEFRSLDGAIAIEKQVTVTADQPKIVCIDLERDAPCQG